MTTMTNGNHRFLTDAEIASTATIQRGTEMRLFDRLPSRLRDRVNYAALPIMAANVFLHHQEVGLSETLYGIRDIELRFAPSFTPIMTRHRRRPRRPCPEHLAYRVPASGSMVRMARSQSDADRIFTLGASKPRQPWA